MKKSPSRSSYRVSPGPAFAWESDSLLTLDVEAQKERSFLRSKIDTLGTQVRNLRSSTARGRAMLYWTSMHSTRGRVPCEASGQASA